MPRAAAPALPTREELLRYVEGSSGRPRVAELMRAFGLRSGARSALRQMMAALEADGAVAPKRSRETEGRRAKSGHLPPVGVVTVTAIDDQGDLICRSEADEAARILLPSHALGKLAPAVGDRLLCRLSGRGAIYTAEPMKMMPRQEAAVVGMLEAVGGELRLRPLDRGAKAELRIRGSDTEGAQAGELVRAGIIPGSPYGLVSARVLDRYGPADQPNAISMAVAARAGLPMAFSPGALAQAKAAKPVALGKRTDLRNLDLVTIDGEDARDFDDAVWAQPDDTPGNAGGWRIVVAIADVAHYVQPGDALDGDARDRGNSVYFPDRVIPMLPEELSNNLCSLRPDGDRACMAALMRINAQGHLVHHHFVRGLMRSRARLTYNQVQAAHDGQPDDLTGPLLEPVIKPLYAAFAVLAEARRKRGALELDLPERRVVMDEQGHITAIGRRERIASHMLIEEMMILANVAAATALEEKVQLGLYRVHDKPDAMKLQALAEYLDQIGIAWSRTAKKPGDFTALLSGTSDEMLRENVSSLILRSQAQAVYSPRNIGHFGLNLFRYAHFTSPIRRYSDLVVHRALIRCLRLGEGGMADANLDQLSELGAHLSRTERRAMEAERGVMDRLMALYMSQHVGARFAARVTNVQRFGLFVALAESGAEGLVPVSTLGDDYYVYEERRQQLIGRNRGETFSLGDRLQVQLVQADAVSGSLAFEVVGRDSQSRPSGKRTFRQGKPGRPPLPRRAGRR